MNRFRKDKQKEVTLQDLQQEINLIKKDIKNLKIKDKTLEEEITILKINKKFLEFENESSNESISTNNKFNDQTEDNKLSIINKINLQKWHSKIKLIIQDYEIEVITLIDTGADLNCIK